MIALLLVVCGFLFWRLVEGPLSLDFLTPVLVEAFDAQDQAGASAQITGTRLVWDEKRQSLELQVTGLTVDDAAGERSFALPLANIDFSFGRLLEGKVEVTRIEMIGARLTVRRNTDGRFEVLLFQAKGSSPRPKAAQDQPRTPSLTNPGASGQTGGEVALSAIDALLKGGGLGPIKDLRTISLRRARILVDDRVLGINWSLPAETIVLRRDEHGLSGEIDVGLPFGTDRAQADLAFVYDTRTATLDLAGQIDELDLATLSALLPQVQGLTVLTSELSGDVSATLGDQGKIFFVDFELAVGRGLLRPAFDALPPVAVSGGVINGRANLAARTLSIYDARLKTGTAEDPGPEIATTFSLKEEGEAAWDLKMTAQASPFAVEQLDWLWPAVYGASAHEWVTQNITEGTVQNLAAALDLRLSAAGAEYETLSGSFDFEDLTLHYLRPMPPMTKLTGRTKVTGDQMVFEVRQGQSEGLALGPGTVTLAELAGDDPNILIEMPVSGTLSDMLAILDQPPLGLLSKAGIDIKGAKGRGSLDVTMGFPLLNDLDSKDMRLTAKGNFRDVLMRDVVLGQDIASPSLSLSSTLDRLTLDGEAEIAGSRVETSYVQDYDGSLVLKGRGDDIKASTIVALAPALEGILGGSLAGSFEVKGNPSGRLTVDVNADITRTSVSPPVSDWSKPAGVPGRAEGEIVLDDGIVTAVDRLNVTGPSGDFAGSVAFDSDGKLRSARMARVRFRQFDLTDVRIDQQSSQLEVSVGGGTLDARPWIERGDNPLQETKEKLDEANAPPKALVTIKNLERVILPDGELRNVSATVDDTQTSFAIELAGTLFTGGRAAGQVALALQPLPDGGQRGSLSLADTGAMLRALGLGDYIRGGRLTWRGQTTPSQPKGAMRGNLDVGPFHLNEVPSALRVIMVAGLTGIEDALSGPGVNFDKLVGDLAINDDRFYSKQLRAVGSALGILASGTLDVSADSIDLEGKVVPAYAINSFLDKIPVLGSVITGGEDQGLFAVSYDVEGSLRDPRVTVNPLSAITPPVLRSLVETITDGSSDGDSSNIDEPSGSLR